LSDVKFLASFFGSADFLRTVPDAAGTAVGSIASAGFPGGRISAKEFLEEIVRH
jgi:hypothetical protein